MLLGGCSKITDVGVRALAESCKGLTTITLWSCDKITSGCKQALKEKGITVYG